jgi:UDP-N-acetylmuramoyl-L-alanyl-D-glutamate--2,6-diaminopimelate ligase
VKTENIFEHLTDVIETKGPIPETIGSISYDSRKVSKSGLFVAISGFTQDGHDFINDAINKGATVIIGEKELDFDNAAYIRVKDSRIALAQLSALFYGFPGKELKVIGVTGTNGKTTTTYLIKAILEHSGYKTGVIGTIGNYIDKQVLPAERTTPESLELNNLFSKMLTHNVEYVVMEVSSHSLKLHRVEGIDFDIGIFTNLTQDHLDFHKTLEDYYNSKRKLFEMSKKAIVNIDDEYGIRLVNEVKVPVFTFGIHHEADLRAENISIKAKGVAYELIYKDNRIPVFYGVPGEFSVYNSMAAIGAGLTVGLDLEHIVKAVEKVEGVSGRFEPVKGSRQFTVIVDYAHTPDGLENVLKTIRNFCTGRIITVFGCGGDRDRQKRPMMGNIAAKLSDYVIVTSDNPRTEETEKIIQDIEQGILTSNYEKIIDRKRAIGRAIDMAQKGDVVLIAGKGHENYQILRDKTIPFDDKEIAAEFLREKESKNDSA